MVWKVGQSGNPGGSVREKKFLQALERAVLADNGKKLRSAAEKLLSCAAEGEAWAIQQLADRLDGKPTQQVDMTVKREPRELSDEDLHAIAGGSSEGAAASQAGEEKPTQLH